MSEIETLVGGTPNFEGGLREVGPGIHAWLQPNGDLGESNAGLIVGGKESLLVDTLWDLRLTRRMLDAMGAVTGAAPIKTLFNTHGDGDHWWGNELVDGAEIIASEAAAAQMAHDTPKEIGRMTSVLGLGRTATRIPLLPFPGKASIKAATRYFEPRLGAYDWSRITPRAATRTFSSSEAMDIGGREVRLEYVGPAHTPGDSIAYVPDADLVFAGDIVFNGVTPIIWAGPVSNWVAALERIGELGAKTIVGGHGPIANTSVLHDLIGYWHMIESEARAMRTTGASAGDAARMIVASDEYAAAPWGSWLNRERTSVNVAMVYREIDRPSAALSPIERLKLLFGAAGLAAEISRAG